MSSNHSKTKNPQSSGCRSRPLPRKTKTKRTKWTQKWKNKPSGNPHTSINDQDSTVRGTWKVNSHFTGALPTGFNTDRLNAFNPTTVIWMELSDTSIPHFSQAAEANPSSAPFRLTPASCKTTALCRKCWIFCRGQRRARSCTASLVPPSSFSGLHWERD